MEGRRRFHGLEDAIITAVVRKGPDVVVTFRNAQLERRFPWRFLRHLRFYATARFIDAHRINSEIWGNPGSSAHLEPGWQVSVLTFDGLSADLPVYFTEMHMSYPVSHRIWCDDVRLSLRFDLLGSLKGYYFPASTSVSHEPAPSPPIEGQEGPIGR